MEDKNNLLYMTNFHDKILEFVSEPYYTTCSVYTISLLVTDEIEIT